MGHSSGQQCLSCSWRSVQENTLGLGDTQRLKDLRMLDRELDNLLHLLNLLRQSTDHVVSGVWDFLNLHEGNQRIDLGWKDLVQQVGVRSARNSDVWQEEFSVNFPVDIDDILAFSADLDEALLLSHHLGYFTDLGGWLK